MDENDDDYLEKAVKHMLRIQRVKKISEADWGKTVPVNIGDIPALVEIDSGADANIMDEAQHRALLKRGGKTTPLEKTGEGIRGLQATLEPVGEFYTVVNNPTRGVKTKFIVIKGSIDSPPLLSRETSTQLGMLRTDAAGRFGTENELRIKKLSRQNIIAKYQAAFEGIGNIRDMKNNKDIKVGLELEEGTVPVAQKPRHIAYYLEEPLKKWLEQGIREGIFEKTPKGEAITWCSPLVVQPKPRFVGKKKLEPHEIRTSIDLRVANQHMKRQRMVQAPLIEDFTHKFHDCTVWSKLDLKQGYHQLTLDEQTREIATFSTPWGNYRPKRLVFGARSSQDAFDDVMYRIFGNIPRCLNQRDDILLGGKDMAEHDAVLEQVLQQAIDFNVTFNIEKCQFATETIDFFGHRFTEYGLRADPKKVQAIKECSRPNSKEAVRSFLGMAGYLDNFIPNYAAIAAPLRMLTRDNINFQWTDKEDQAFRAIQDAISREQTMAFFDPKLPIVVRTEASFNEGLSAALFQKTGKGKWGLQPVHFISQTLTDTE